MRPSDLSADQRLRLTELGESYPEPICHASRATAFAALARKGLAKFVLSTMNRGWRNSSLTPNGIELLKSIAPDVWKRIDADIQSKAFPKGA